MRPGLKSADIDELLPQTQCGLCGYQGCLPYAKAIVFEDAPINLCPPGGLKTLHALAEKVKEDPTPFIADMQKKALPQRLAKIREAECIGCTKCIDACPVDAILGSAKSMHIILKSECTGCMLCLPPCPVDCIETVLIAQIADETEQKQKSAQARQRTIAKQKRMIAERTEKAKSTPIGTLAERKAYVEKAFARISAKQRLT